MPDWLQLILRSLLLIFVLFFLIKYLGNKRINQLSIFHFTSIFVLSSLGAIVILNRNINIVAGIGTMLVWLIIPLVIDMISLKSKAFRDFVQGKSIPMIKEGKIMEDNLKKERIPTDDLLYHLREKDIFKAADVEFALLEPTGKITIMPKSEQQPLTKQDMNIKSAPQSEIHTVIADGEILLEPLAEQEKGPAWLLTELEKMNVTKENVFLAQLDDDAQLTIDLYDDKLTTQAPTEKPLILATLKKAEADLALFALATENSESKACYQRNEQQLKQVIEQVTPYL